MQIFERHNNSTLRADNRRMILQGSHRLSTGMCESRMTA